jgi:hypothetical protein
MSDFELNFDDFEEEFEAFIAATQGGSITGYFRSETNDAVALELEDGLIIEFRADGSLLIAGPEGGEDLVLQLKNEEQRLAELAFWGFGKPPVGR